MHFEVLVEDRSGSIALEHILEKILGPNYSEHSWQIHPYKGIERLPSQGTCAEYPIRPTGCYWTICRGYYEGMGGALPIPPW